MFCCGFLIKAMSQNIRIRGGIAPSFQVRTSNPTRTQYLEPEPDSNRKFVRALALGPIWVLESSSNKYLRNYIVVGTRSILRWYRPRSNVSDVGKIKTNVTDNYHDILVHTKEIANCKKKVEKPKDSKLIQRHLLGRELGHEVDKYRIKRNTMEVETTVHSLWKSRPVQWSWSPAHSRGLSHFIIIGVTDRAFISLGVVSLLIMIFTKRKNANIKSLKDFSSKNGSRQVTLVTWYNTPISKYLRLTKDPSSRMHTFYSRRNKYIICHSV